MNRRNLYQKTNGMVSMASETAKKRKKRKKTRYAGSKKVIAVITVIVVIFFLYKAGQVRKKSAENMETIAQLEIQIEAEKAERKSIEDRAAYMQSDDYIEDIARDKLGLVYENEIIFKKDRN